MLIRDEQAGDEDAIRQLVEAAFHDHPHGDQREHLLIDVLRASGAMILSLVADQDGAPVGHIAFSPVRIDGACQHWYGLGPVAVIPARQRSGIGQALVHAGLVRLKSISAAGCVVLGDPTFYTRFGFAARQQLTFAGAPLEYFLSLPFGATVPAGTVEYHPSFYHPSQHAEE
ncbi:GCN5 family N-acetyltransferase [Skermanella stibiiresistens SB22]|uniref:GCN5 family N-acetyltransferase n=1 Tax=Skermanella stibiiresistens SB22 TaxID=1385369 RepID=W9GWJ3_9PROT|nr:N-acetyltransferase [Skermanella stibiiresistens]EWY35858.1 GCN5 family N-acetyltransferase [Skermanella stibiiresistens SB22]